MSDETPIPIACTLTAEEGRALAQGFRARAYAILCGLDRARPEDEALRKILVAAKAWERGWMQATNGPEGRP